MIITGIIIFAASQVIGIIAGLYAMLVDDEIRASLLVLIILYMGGAVLGFTLVAIGIAQNLGWA